MELRLNLIPRASLVPVLSLAPGDGKKRDPGNEVGYVTRSFCIQQVKVFLHTVMAGTRSLEQFPRKPPGAEEYERK